MDPVAKANVSFPTGSERECKKRAVFSDNAVLNAVESFSSNNPSWSLCKF